MQSVAIMALLKRQVYVTRVILTISDGVLEDMSLASRVLEDTFSRPWPWPRVLGLGLESQVLGLVKFSMTRRCTDTAAKKVLMIRAKTVRVSVRSHPDEM